MQTTLFLWRIGLIKLGRCYKDLVSFYKCLRRELRIGRDNQTCEITRRIGIAWAGFRNLQYVFKANALLCLKREVYDQCVLFHIAQR